MWVRPPQDFHLLRPRLYTGEDDDDDDDDDSQDEDQDDDDDDLRTRQWCRHINAYLSVSTCPTFLVVAHVSDSLEDTEDDHIQSGRLFYGMTTYNRYVNKL